MIIHRFDESVVVYVGNVETPLSDGANQSFRSRSRPGPVEELEHGKPDK